jgi:peptide/nickel transport system ATP-binding protein
VAEPLLRVRGLACEFSGVSVIDRIDFDIAAGETLGIIGESGSGKSVTALSVMRLIGRPGRVTADSIAFEGRDLLRLPEDAMRRVRGGGIGMIFQEPMTSLNPVLTIGDQIGEMLRVHRGQDRASARSASLALLRRVEIPAADRRIDDYPHQLSGGMRQRAMIAIALACRPRLLIADEPTTALDVTIQAQILELLRGLQRDLGMAMLLITHDLGVVSEIAGRVAVMYAGRIVERAPAGAVFARPYHPYTGALLAAIPRLDQRRGRLASIEGAIPNPADPPAGCRFHPRCGFAAAICAAGEPALEAVEPGRATACVRHQAYRERGEPAIAARTAPTARAVPPDAAAPPLLEVAGLAKFFAVRPHFFGGGARAATLKAVDGVDFRVAARETFAIVGESGCGKSTTGRLLLRLLEPSAGSIRFDGHDLLALSPRALRGLRRDVQMVFQDPAASVNARMLVGDIVAEPLVIHGIGDRASRALRVRELLQQVGLAAEHGRRYPHEFSGGQRQRIAIARALALAPKLLVCDEPVSALDVSVQAQIVNLLGELQAALGLTYVFISHNLAVVRHIADRVAVMYLGRIVELAETERLYASPLHPYTQALLSAVPGADAPASRIILQGDVPSPVDPPGGCRFHTRCRHATALCREADPPLVAVGPGQFAACHLVPAWTESSGLPLSL